MVLLDGHELTSVEEKRLKEDRDRTKYWKKWGPYVSERQWATAREDYSTDGKPWTYFTHEDARKRAYRWGEDGIAGVCDSHGWLNIAFSFWNGKDEILKERLFGISSEEGNHGQSIKEAHFHIDNVPTHSYMKYLYKYPQKEFPYRKILENSRRSKDEREYSLLDTGVFENDAYWDIFIEVAKGDDDPEELHFRVVAWNRGSERAPIHIIPQTWFRNTWAWGHEPDTLGEKPSLELIGQDSVRARHKSLGELFLNHSPSPGVGDSGIDALPKIIFTDNETNLDALGLGTNKTPYVKDAFHKHIINEATDAINPNQTGTKCGSWYAFDEDGGVNPGECAVVRFKLMREALAFLDEELFDDVIERRREEADEFYSRLSPLPMSDDLRNIQRQAFAGLLWSKQYYHFNWEQWAKGDPTSPAFMRKNVHNRQGKQIHWEHVLSARDSWEYPFTNPWDSAFDCVVMAMLDPDFARYQLDLLTRENYMQPSGQIPSSDCNFDEVDPPVLAWATFRVFKIERKMYGRQDLEFLENVFQKLLLNFTWWVNRKDTEGKNIFEGGFLGLDNIGPFDRSAPLPTGGTAVLQQADSTAWMAFYCLSMLNIALELAKYRRNYERLAAKFFEHFILISDAMGDLWNTEDGFYYDAISWGGGKTRQLRVRSLVGLIPLLATLTLEPEMTNKVPWFKKRLDWFIENRSDLAERNIASIGKRGQGNRLLLALASKDRLERILKRLLDEEEFFSEHGIRSLSKYHKENPYCVTSNGKKFEVGYQPAQSDGNTNWRGPIWMTINFLLIESLQRFYLFYGNSLQVECPTGSGDYMPLSKVAEELQQRLEHLFAGTVEGRRSINAGNDTRDYDPLWKDYVSFYEFFDGDTGRGLGAYHHCGSSSLISRIIHDTGDTCDFHDNEDLIGPDQDKLAEVIERGKIPLVKYSSSLGKMEILEFEPGTRYAIISHVWADGYGNPNENKIHKCVLEFFNKLFLDTQNLLGRKDPDPELPFWIDTLTIPVKNPIQRKRAIMTMHHAYTNADFMVIIDSALAKMEVGKSYSETAMKIFTSRWIGRLWTLQEAYLSKKLIFRFDKSELVDMDQLESNFFTSHTLADSMVAGKARKYFDRLLGWQRQKRIYGVPIYDSVLLASVWEAVQWRTTSLVVHETQALATLFEIEVDFPDDFDHGSCGPRCGEAAGGPCRENLDKRMTYFLESLYDAYPNSIPPGIIFVPRRRLAVEGFGWAPCTWMVGQNVGHDDPIFTHTTAAELTLNGLLVRYPGFLLRSSENRIYDPVEQKFAFPCDILLLEWYCVQPCDSKTETLPSMDGLAIISSKEEVREDKVIALLVSVKKTRRPKLYVEILRRVWIWRERDQTRIEELRRTFWDHKVSVCEYGEILNGDQQWCIGKHKWDPARLQMGDRLDSTLSPL